jgi:hypothetical protein
LSHLCVADHGEDDAEALPGIRLCRACRKGLTRDLERLPRLHADLASILPTGGAQGGSGRVTGSSAKPLPIRGDVADLRDQIRHDLVWWCLFVSERRGLDLPIDRVPEIAAWLGRHAEWIAGHEVAAVECPPVMRDLAGRAHGLLNPSGAKRIQVGVCHDSTEAGPCKGTLWATCRAEDDPRPSELYCDGPCGLRKDAAEWRRWGREYLKGRMVS